MTRRVLDIGCGPNKVPGATGMDRRTMPGVDVVHDLNSRPDPFDDNAFDEIHARHVLEHVDDMIGVMEEKPDFPRRRLGKLLLVMIRSLPPDVRRKLFINTTSEIRFILEAVKDA